MKINKKLTNEIIGMLKQSMSRYDLKIEKQDEPDNRNYLSEWVIRDREDWIYGYFGTSENQYLYATVHDNSFPFDATEKLLWIKTEIPRIVNLFLADG